MKGIPDTEDIYSLHIDGRKVLPKELVTLKLTTDCFVNGIWEEGITKNYKVAGLDEPEISFDRNCDEYKDKILFVSNNYIPYIIRNIGIVFKKMEEKCQGIKR